MRVLSRAWQMLLKGIAEVQAAGRPIAAAEMVLVRLAYAADLPTPDEAVRALDERDGAATAARAAGTRRRRRRRAAARRALASRRAARQVRAPRSRRRAPAADDPRRRRAPTPPRRCRAATASRTWSRSRPRSATSRSRRALERDVRLVRFEEGQIEIRARAERRETLANDLSRKLAAMDRAALDGRRVGGAGAPTLHEQAEAARRERKDGVRAIRWCRRCWRSFPGAEIVDVRRPSRRDAPASR